jgi:hypothetical protein
MSRIGSKLRHEYVPEALAEGPEYVEQSPKGLQPDMNATYQRILSDLSKERTLESERKRISSALFWLCVKMRSMTTSELLTLALLEDRYDSLTLDDVDGPQKTDVRAAEELKELLGATIEIVDAGGGVFTVQICNSTLRDFLMREQVGIKVAADERVDAPFTFTRSEAEAHCARICMSICSVSTLRLAERPRLLGQAHVLEYAWQFWAHHFNNSSHNLRKISMVKSFDSMLLFTVTDSLSMMESLAHFLNHRLQMSRGSSMESLEAVRSTQIAQEAIAKSLRQLVTISQSLPLSRALQSQRDTQERRANSGRISPLRNRFGPFRQAAAYLAKSNREKTDLTSLQIDRFLPPSNLLPEDASSALADLARGLRLVTATIAVNPVYGEKGVLSGSSNFTPVTALVHISNLFELAASFSFWPQKSVSLSVDPLSYFDLPSGDPFAKHAVVVRRRFATTKRHDPSSDLVTDTSSPYQEMPVGSSLSPTPWVGKMWSYGLYPQGNTHIIRAFVLNPLAQAHMHYDMFLSDTRRRSMLFDSPAAAMSRHVPREFEDAPLAALVATLPAIWRVHLVKHVEVLAKPLVSYVWPFLHVQYASVEFAKTNAKSLWDCVQLIWDSESRMSYSHWPFALALYFVRRKYFLWIGGDLSPHPAQDLREIFYDPLSYFKRSLLSWSMIGWHYAQLMLGSALVDAAVGYTRCPHSHPEAFVPCVLLAFWTLTGLERSVCASAYALSYPLVYITILFQGAEAIKQFLNISVAFWLRVLFSVGNWGSSLATSQVLGNESGFLAVLASYALSLCLVMCFENVFGTFVWASTYPLQMTISMAKHGVLAVYTPVSVAVGIISTLLLVLLGTGAFLSFCTDPLDLQGTKERVELAAGRARQTLRERPRFHIEAKKSMDSVRRSPNSEKKLKGWGIDRDKQAQEQVATRPAAEVDFEPPGFNNVEYRKPFQVNVEE